MGEEREEGEVDEERANVCGDGGWRVEEREVGDEKKDGRGEGRWVRSGKVVRKGGWVGGKSEGE